TRQISSPCLSSAPCPTFPLRFFSPNPMLEGSILQKLEIAHRHSARPIRFGVYYKNTLVSLCHALEDHILTNDGEPLVIAAFQQGKWYLQEAQRYADIAQHSHKIAIMAAL